MTTLLSHRAKRFHALHDLLTGAACAKLPQDFEVSNRLRRDIGLAEHPRAPAIALWVGHTVYGPFSAPIPLQELRP